MKLLPLLSLLMFAGQAAYAWPYGSFQVTAGEDGSFHDAASAEKAAESDAQASCSGKKPDQLSEWSVTYQQATDSYAVSAEFLCSDT